jgi:two-component system, NarL family, nitrate/nitrite response regulator NarL
MSSKSAPGAGSGRATTELSIRQRDVLQLLRQGETNKVIARKLNIREGTVALHIRNIMKRLGARNRTRLVLLTKKLLWQIEGGGTRRPREKS